MSKLFALSAPDDAPIIGTLERLTGVAYINGAQRTDQGRLNVQYAGKTKIWWDDQRTVTRNGELVFVDGAGREWRESELSLRLMPEPEGPRP